tara:strand:+ start:1984 stop:2145 length:162 start_codon:yes stop_codon:yes gene_type:complete
LFPKAYRSIHAEEQGHRYSGQKNICQGEKQKSKTKIIPEILLELLPDLSSSDP